MPPLTETKKNFSLIQHRDVKQGNMLLSIPSAQLKNFPYAAPE